MSEKKKPVTPYARLKRTFHEWASEIVWPKKKLMFLYAKDKLAGANWRLDDLAERVAAAKQLGYDVVAVNEDDGLRFYYVKARPTDLPWDARL